MSQPKIMSQPKVLTPAQKASLRANTLAKALSHVGTEETPRYSNRGDLVDRCNLYVGNSPGSEPAWCLAHAVYCVGMTAESMGLSLADTLVERTGYCPTEYVFAKGRGTVIAAADAVAGTATVLPGDLVLVFYDNEDLGKLPHHAGIVERPPTQGNPAFTSVEGNTVPDGFQGSESRGFGVFRKRRNATDRTPNGHAHYVFLRMV